MLAAEKDEAADSTAAELSSMSPAQLRARIRQLQAELRRATTTPAAPPPQSPSLASITERRGVLNAALAGSEDLDVAPFISATEFDFYGLENSGPSSASEDSDSDSGSDEDEDEDGEEEEEESAVVSALKKIMSFGTGRAGKGEEEEHAEAEEDEETGSEAAAADAGKEGEEEREEEEETAAVASAAEGRESPFNIASSAHSSPSSSMASSRSSLSTSSSVSSSHSTTDRFPYERNILALQPFYLITKRLYACRDAVTYRAVALSPPHSASASTSAQHESLALVVLKVADEYTGKKDPKEVRLLTAVQGHPRICRLLGWHPLLATECSAMVTEFVRSEEVECRVMGSSWRRQQYMRDLLQALRHMHSRNVLYRDVKPSNVLWSEQLQHATVIDFDVATFYDARRRHRSVVGTDGYLSPEIMRIQDDKKKTRDERKRREEEGEDEEEEAEEEEEGGGEEEEVDAEEGEGEESEHASASGSQGKRSAASDPSDAGSRSTSGSKRRRRAPSHSPVPALGYGFPTDVYSAGVTFASLLLRVSEDDVADLENASSKGPAMRRRCLRRLQQVRQGSRSRQQQPELDLIVAMLHDDQHSRITVDQALQHPFFDREWDRAKEEEEEAQAAEDEEADKLEAEEEQEREREHGKEGETGEEETDVEQEGKRREEGEKERGSSRSGSEAERDSASHSESGRSRSDKSRHSDSGKKRSKHREKVEEGEDADHSGSAAGQEEEEEEEEEEKEEKEVKQLKAKGAAVARVRRGTARLGGSVAARGARGRGRILRRAGAASAARIARY